MFILLVYNKLNNLLVIRFTYFNSCHKYSSASNWLSPNVINKVVIVEPDIYVTSLVIELSFDNACMINTLLFNLLN